MTWSYDEALPADKDKLRSLIGDTDARDQLISDEALEMHLDLEGALYPAAAAACRAIAARFARRVDFTQSGLSLSASQVAARYSAMADSFAARARDGAAGASGDIGTPVVGGVSEAAIQSAREDTDLVQPRLTHDLDDVPGAAEPPFAGQVP